MNIEERTQEIQDLNAELLKVRAGMKTLFGRDYQEAEYKVIQLRDLIHRAEAFLEIGKYGSLANG